MSKHYEYSKDWCQGFCTLCGTACADYCQDIHNWQQAGDRMDKQIDDLRSQLADADRVNELVKANVASLEDQLQWSLRNEEKYKARLREQTERVSQLTRSVETWRNNCSDEQMENARLREALDTEELEGELAANEFQGGEFNAGAAAVLRRWIKTSKEALQARQVCKHETMFGNDRRTECVACGKTPGEIIREQSVQADSLNERIKQLEEDRAYIFQQHGNLVEENGRLQERVEKQSEVIRELLDAFAGSRTLTIGGWWGFEGRIHRDRYYHLLQFYPKQDCDPKKASPSAERQGSPEQAAGAGEHTGARNGVEETRPAASLAQQARPQCPKCGEAMVSVVKDFENQGHLEWWCDCSTAQHAVQPKPPRQMHSCDIPGCVSCGNPEETETAGDE